MRERNNKEEKLNNVKYKFYNLYVLTNENIM